MNGHKQKQQANYQQTKPDRLKNQKYQNNSDSSKGSIESSSQSTSNQSTKRNIMGMGDLLNTKLVSKTGIGNKENKYMFGSKLNKINKDIDDLDDEIDNISQQIDESENESDNDNDNDSGRQNQLSQVMCQKVVIPDQFNELHRQMSQRSIQMPGSQLQNPNSSKLWKSDDPLVESLQKIDLLDDIHDLIPQLQEEGVQLNFLPQLNFETHISTLKNVKHILTKRVRRLQSSTLIDESLYLGLLGVEKIFDQNTKIGGLSVNLKGLSKSVSLKLKNQKQQLTDSVENIFQKFGIGSNSKLIMQVVISGLKRVAINSDQSDQNDLSDNLKTLQDYYKNQ